MGLDRTPASDLIAGTAAMWVDALTNGRVWEQEPDAPRFRRAFVKLSQTRRQWPAPADFLEALPPREQLVLTKQPIPADPDSPAMKKRFEQIGKMLAAPPRKKADSGHGHVHPRADGQRARCGGPGICDQCSREQALANAQVVRA